MKTIVTGVMLRYLRKYTASLGVLELVKYIVRIVEEAIRDIRVRRVLEWYTQTIAHPIQNLI